MYYCHCGKEFRHASSLARHKGMHSALGKEDIHVGMDKVLHHPFTMLVTGPTGCGKTTFVKQLLENVEQRIQPPPQRIIWGFGQWQPLYIEIKNTHPGIEFMMGIPDELNSPDFLNPRVRNLMIVDDLMSDATKDRKISDLFTKGSHHRNLSVICLLQNIFHHGRENRTISLNTHYIVLYKNPRDQNQVRVLSQQMYPGNSHKLLDAYNAATLKPYGHLLIDLKQETPEHLRLCYDKTHQTMNEHDSSHLKGEPFTKTVQSNDIALPYDLNSNENPFKEMSQYDTSIMKPPYQFIASIKDTIPSNVIHSDNKNYNMKEICHCDYCGVMLISRMDLQNHIQNCPMNEDIDDPPMKKLCTEGFQENPVYIRLKDKAINKFKDQIEEQEAKYIDKQKGNSEYDRRYMANQKFLPKIRETFKTYYKYLVEDLLDLQCSPTHKEIMVDIQQLMSTGIPFEDAFKKTMLHHNYMTEDIINVGLYDDADVSDESYTDSSDNDEASESSDNESDETNDSASDNKD